ncbi:MAG: thiamine phosphate synthase [Gemmatimonadetes bacterium]|nr:thiamine phosphate synthase [Gemmatimonadota bacterium]
MISADVEERLRLVVVTDAPLAAPRTVEEVVARALEGGARAVQLRNKGDSAGDILALGRTLRTLTRAAGALLFVNDRLDVALAVDADGVHVGPEDLPVAAVRAVSPPGFLVGRSARDPDVARRAVREGADYIGCGSVYPTSTKTDVGDIIGLEGLGRVVESVEVPVLAIGGITAERASDVAATGAAGIAAVGAVMRAADPAAAARAFLAPFHR